MRLATAGLLAATTFASADAAVAQAPQAIEPGLAADASPVVPELLYKGWRAKALLGRPVRGWNGEELGQIADILITPEGRIAEIAVEGGGILGLGEAVFRLPWTRLDLTPGLAGVMVPVTRATLEELGLYGGPGEIVVPRGLFRITQIIGDAARLATLVQFGTVADLIFSRAGIALAVLVTRGDGGGGDDGGGLGEEQGQGPQRAFAYPFRGEGALEGERDRDFYLLPFETAEAAARAPRVELDRFDAELF